MKSYPSLIDGHPISCVPLPTWVDTGKTDRRGTMEKLIALHIQGSGQPTHMVKTLNVWKTNPANGERTQLEKNRKFYLGKNFEYYDGQISLTSVLLAQHKISSEYLTVEIR